MIKDLILGDYSSVSSSGSGSGDPNWSSVSLLLTGNSGIVDSSSLNNTLTNLGGVTTTTTSKYGSGALAFDGGTTSMLTATSSGFALGTGDYTLECWMYKRATSADWQCLATTRNSGTGFWFGFGGGSNYPIAYVEGITSTIAVSLNTWTHLAYVRRSGTLYLYVNGVLGGSASSTQNYTNTVLNIGREQAPYNGFATNYILDDFRITKGLARYTANFTPPNTALPVGSYTAGSATPESDSNAKYVSLLLNGDGTNGAQNQTFIDSSTNNATITRYGDATQGSFSPFGDSWSNYFDGTGDYLVVPSSTPLTLGTGDFTIEAWVYPTSVTGTKIIYDTRQSGVSSGIYPIIYLNSATLSYYVNLADRIVSTTPIVPNTWNHIAVSRSGTNTKMFLNGVQVGSTYTDTNNYLNSRNVIGAESNSLGVSPYLGTISNFRVVKGTALYTSNFTPSTTSLTAISGTSLLTCQSNRFVDKSTNNAVITIYGDTKVVKDSPFPEVYDKTIQGASAYFDGTGDYITHNCSTNSTLSFTGDFTIECWVYPNTLSTALYNYITIFDSRASISSTPLVFGIWSGKLDIVYSSSRLTEATATVNANTWNHIVFTRVSGVLKLFTNGILSPSNITASGTISAAGTTAYTGRNLDGDYFNGYISNLRIVKGAALYTSNFTPPTSPLTAVANTSLLLKCDNAGIVDATGKNDLVTYGNAQVSTTQKKYGTGAMYFDGTGDYLTVPAASNYAFGTGDFTVECWVNPSTQTGYQTLFSTRYTASNDASSVFFGFNNNTLNPMMFSNVLVLQSSNSLQLNTWSHVALVRSAGILSIFVNGVVTGTVAFTTNLTGTTPGIGSSADINYPHPFTGYIDDLRITKGLARYTANFTPPTAPLTL